MKIKIRFTLIYNSLLSFALLIPAFVQAQQISRKSVFERHQVVNHKVDTLNALTVGNGRFAMTLDVTGLQTFPATYQKGIPLGTLSDWGWHSFIQPNDSLLNETFIYHSVKGRQVPYAVQPKEVEKKWAADIVRQNPHRLHLAQLGWVLKNKALPLEPQQLSDIEQVLNPWNGQVSSRFKIDGVWVEVETLALQNEDGLLVKVKGPLVEKGLLGVQLRYPFPTNAFLDEANFFQESAMDQLVLKTQSNTAFSIKRTLHETLYYSLFQSGTPLRSEKIAFGYRFFPQKEATEWVFKLKLTPHEPLFLKAIDYATEKRQAQQNLIHYWEQGAILDFQKTQDPRAFELERRMVLSRYLRKVNCSGPNPPQETGLTYNSWYGKPHIEMFWWHALPFALWGNEAVLEQKMGWYFRAFEQAKKMAKRQGYEGIRWQKMTDNQGGETASSVGSYLIWQQPHLLFFAEQLYRSNPNQTTVVKWAPLIEETARFMSSYLNFDSHKKQYNLGPYLIPSQESYPAKTTLNPFFELAYWQWGLEVAQRWRERMGLERNPSWDRQIKQLAPYPSDENTYWAVASAKNPFQDPEQLRDHPSVLGAFSVVPKQAGFSTQKMKNTLQKVNDSWRWDTAWGWDFPMAAMAAIRLGDPNMALEFLLKKEVKNTYLKNGHNYQTPRLRLYLPGNGGLLIALAQMASAPNGSGFPEDWEVSSEGFPNNLYYP